MARPRRATPPTCRGGRSKRRADPPREDRPPPPADGSTSPCHRPATPRSPGALARRARRSTSPPGPSVASTTSTARRARSTARDPSPIRSAAPLAASRRSARSRSVGRSVGRDQVPGVDRVLVLAGGLRVPIHGPRRVAGDDGGRKRLGRPMPAGSSDGRSPRGGSSPRPRRPRAAAHRLGICGVEPSPLRRQESLVGCFLGQRVPEPVSLDGLVGVDDQQLRLDRLAQSHSEIVF